MNGAARWPLIIWLLLVLICVATILEGPPVQSGIGQFLPTAATQKQKLLLDEIRHGTGGRLILLEVSGGISNQLVAASRTLTELLKKSGHFQQVINGTDSSGDSGFELLFKYRYLIAPHTSEDFSSYNLKQAFSARLQELLSPVGMLDKRNLPSDPTAAFRSQIRRWRQGPGPEQRNGVWFSKDGSRALIMLESRYPVFDLDNQQKAIDAIHKAVATLSGGKALSIHISGSPAFAVEARQTIKSEAQMLSLAASLGVSLLLLITFRSPVLVLLAALPLVSGVLAGAAVVILLFDELHAITLAFGIILTGIAVDYPAHLFTHIGANSKARDAIAAIWPIIRLGLLTTTVGFCALLFSRFGGLSQFGVFAIIGLIAAAYVTRFVLPELIRQTTAKSSLESLASRLFDRISLPWLPVLTIVFTAVFLIFRGDSLWEHDLTRLSSISAEAKTMHGQLRQEFGAPDVKRLLLITGENREQVLERSEALETSLKEQVTAGNLSWFVLPSHYLPSIQTQQRNRSALPDPESLRDNITTALQELPFKPGLFEPFLRQLAQSRELPPLTVEHFSGTPFELRISSILSERDGSWVGIVSLFDVADENALEQFTKSFGDEVIYLNLEREASKLVANYRNEALFLSLVGVAIILLALFLTLRSLRLLGRVAIPVAAAVLCTASVLALYGEQLSLFHIAALLLVMGIGIDYALFIALTPTSSHHFNATAGALLLCSLSTLLVFGLLIFSSAPVLHSIGLTVFFGSLLSLLFSVMMVHNSGSKSVSTTRIR